MLEATLGFASLPIHLIDINLSADIDDYFLGLVGQGVPMEAVCNASSPVLSWYSIVCRMWRNWAAVRNHVALFVPSDANT